MMALDLFPAPHLSRETFSSRRLSVVPVASDGMEPTLRGGWDYVLAAPASGFSYDSLYVLDFAGCPTIYRCQNCFNGDIVLARDNPIYSDLTVTADRFAEIVLGIVVCDLKVRDADRLAASWEAGQ